MDNNSTNDTKLVETYAEDIAKVIQDDRNGLIKKIIHDDERKELDKKNASPESIKNKIFLTLSFAFILVGFGVLLYFFSRKDAPTVPISAQVTPLVFLDKSSFVEVKDLTKDEVENTIFNASSNTLVKEGGVEGVYPTLNKNVVSLREFINLIKGSFTSDVLSNSTLTVEDHFLMGVVNSGSDTAQSSGKDFFMLFKVSSVIDTFNSFRTWESKMLFDLQGLFGFVVTPDNKYLFNTAFQDGVVENKNARILYDHNHNIILMYIFADDNSVIITNTENAAKEIMLRLATKQLKK
ncbi:MAG: hypothetical protein WCI76_02220 [bacterium]